MKQLSFLDYMHHKFSICCSTLLLIFPTILLAAPPFLTDDPEPASFRQVQLYASSFLSQATHTTYLDFPSFEIDYGVIPDVELHFITAMTTYLPHPGSLEQGFRTTGWSDTELGFKYKFLHETTYLPDIAMAPALELPTGKANRNIGNGRLWYKLPIWLGKKFGKWTTYFGGGYGINNAPNMKSFIFGGFHAEYDISDFISWGAEIYSQGATATHNNPPFQDFGSYTLINVGGNYNFTSSLSVDMSLGHSIIGDMQYVAYVGIYWGIDT